MIEFTMEGNRYNYEYEGDTYRLTKDKKYKGLAEHKDCVVSKIVLSNRLFAARTNPHAILNTIKLCMTTKILNQKERLLFNKPAVSYDLMPDIFPRKLK